MTQPFKYKPAYGIIVLCNDEADQRTLFEALKKARLTRRKKLRVVSV